MCATEFTQSNALKVHMMTHTGETPLNAVSVGEDLQTAVTWKHTRGYTLVKIVTPRSSARSWPCEEELHSTQGTIKTEKGHINAVFVGLDSNKVVT